MKKSAVFAAIMLAGCSAQPQAGAPEVASAAPQAVDNCKALAGRDFGHGIAITEATHVAAAAAGTVGPVPFTNTADLPAHCLVKGIIDKRTGAGGKTYGIQFALALPQDWSGRFLMMGGGGLNGTVGQPWGPVAAGMTPALARGFAVVAHDSGHAGTVWDSSFSADQRAALDFAESSVPTVTKAARAITESYYGTPVAHSYMTGCSTGGREGMLAIERYPELFDGVIVGAPAMMTGDSNTALDRMKVAFNQAAPRDAEGKPIVSEIFPPSVRAVIKQGILDQCDTLDGLEDGVIENVAQCRFDPKKLVCKPGQNEGCLSAKVAGALDQGFQPTLDSLGHLVYPRYPYDTGIVDPMGGLLPTGAPGPFGPAIRDLTYNVDAAAWAAHHDAIQRLVDTNYWTNLNTFLDRGGKTIFYHGTSDFFFSPWATWDWWTRALATNGPRFAEASRFYMVPGMLHCRGGESFDNFDLLSDLVTWVEQGKASDRPTASRSDGSASRPLCQFPAHAQYTGGDATKPESFQCKLPSEG